jgi:hypothetical protein
MKSFIFTKHYNMPMVASLLLIASGLQTLFSDDCVIGALMVIIGLVAYLGSDCEPHVEVPTPAPALPKPIDPVLLPIEWEAAFDEPVPSIPALFATPPSSEPM